MHRNWTARFLHRDDDLVLVELHAGANYVLIKVQNHTEGWGFACRALDPIAATEKLRIAIERYVRITRWNGWSIGSFDAFLEQMRDKPRLILDVRDNGGGQDELADLAIGRFLSQRS